MNSFIRVVSAATVVLSTLGAAALAGPPAAKVAKAPATISCPACKMPMPQKKSAATPVPVAIKGTTYYCCAGCPAGMSALKMAAEKAAAKSPKTAVKTAAPK